jgi:hypothetical protein
MVTDDECDAIMGKILVEAESPPVKANTVICTVFHPVENNDNDKKDDKESTES